MSQPLDDAALHAAVVAFFASGAAFGGATRVEVRETHMSWVFLAGDEAWKLKKPERLGALDLQRFAQRRELVLEELRLNRRFARPVYLGVGAVMLDAAGAFHLRAADDEGEPIGAARDERIVELVLRMRRLAADGMLDAALADGRADAAQMRGIAAAIAACAAVAPRVAFGVDHHAAVLRDDLVQCAQALRSPRYGLDVATIDRIEGALLDFVVRRRSLLAQRLSEGRVVEGHGDLRPEHVWLGPPVMFIDCLEFSRPLREVDVADDLGFLALEIERMGRADLAQALLDAYREASGDALPQPLVDFHRAHRALIRARLAIRHLDEARYRGMPKWPAQARSYLALALRYASSV